MGFWYEVVLVCVSVCNRKYTSLHIVYVPFDHVPFMVPSRWSTLRILEDSRLENASQDRAIGAGPAGLAATGQIFGQLARAKMPYELWWLFNCCFKSSYDRRDLQ